MQENVFSRNTLDFNYNIKYNESKLIIERDDREAKYTECTESRQMV